MDDPESIRRQIRSTETLHSVVRTMKGLSMTSIHQREQAVESLADYERPLLRVAVLLLVLRLPGILLAFALQMDVCFVTFPFAPTPEGQYLIKDLTLFAIAAFIGEESTTDHYH